MSHDLAMTVEGTATELLQCRCAAAAWTAPCRCSSATSTGGVRSVWTPLPVLQDVAAAVDSGLGARSGCVCVAR